MIRSVLPYKVVLPLILGIAASLAIAVYAELGYRRLESANRQMAIALEMQASLHAMLALIVDAETGQRGYLLTGREDYLTPYNTAIPKVEGAFSRLRELLVQNGSPAQRDMLGRLNSLVGKKLVELEVTIALYKKDGETCTYCHTGAAAELPNSKFCKSCHKLEMPHKIDDGSKEKFPHKDGFEKKTYKKAQCANCHKTAFCDNCHHEGSVSGKPWVRYHPNVVKKDGADACFECHEETYCSNCHVNLAKRGLD